MISLVGSRGVIYWLLAVICCSSRDVRWGRGYRVSRQVAISTSMIVNDWAMLSATDGCSNVADGAEVPEVFRIAVVLAAETYVSIVR